MFGIWHSDNSKSLVKVEVSDFSETNIVMGHSREERKIFSFGLTEVFFRLSDYPNLRTKLTILTYLHFKYLHFTY